LSLEPLPPALPCDGETLGVFPDPPGPAPGPSPLRAPPPPPDPPEEPPSVSRPPYPPPADVIVVIPGASIA